MHGMVILTSLTIDRLLATVYGSVYKLHQRRYIIIFYSSIFAYSVLLIFPQYLLMYYAEHRCESLLLSFKAFAYIWMVFFYFVPSGIMLGVHFRVVLYLNQRAAPVGTGNSASATEANKAITQTTRRLTIATICFTAVILLANAYGTIYFILDSLSVAIYYFGTWQQEIDVFLSGVASTTNPIILLIALPKLRAKIFKRFQSVLSILLRRLGHSEQERTSRINSVVSSFTSG
ncbi:unnamed protein product [Calicophoron daubneyi]|uniref:G-protein coupled receptors family 1 profile domain-containing protein n=1 Tax=Calicophoron daubneyi TaxID=300641 RepID=A0AAV2U1I1_CALDB